MRAASGSTCHLARDHTAVERLEEHGMVGWWHPSALAFAFALALGLGLGISSSRPRACCS